MLLHIPGILGPDEAGQYRERLAASATPWVDGRQTVGEQGARVKHNLQLDAHSVPAREMGAQILRKLVAHPVFFSAVLPLRTLPPLFNRYEAGGTYGLHVDGAVMSRPDGASPLRSDVSSTLFLSEPESYDGGELVVKDTYGSHEVKLAAGDLIIYPASSLHQVLPVTRGVRLAAFFWSQSMVRDDMRRSMLYELDRTIQSLRARLGEVEDTVALTGHYHNLLRQWVEV